MADARFEPIEAPHFNRRRMLTLLGVGAVAATGVSVLAACGSDGGSSSPSIGLGPSGAPAPGGTVRMGFAGGGAAEALNPAYGAQTPVELARTSVVYDPLFAFIDGKPVPQLADSAEVTQGAVILRVRDGVTWHDGSPLVAEDVVFTLRSLADPARPYPSELSAFFDLAATSATDARTLSIPTITEVGNPQSLLAGANVLVMKNGTTEFTVESSIGTGPYRLMAFAAGQESRLVKFENYWGGAPNADELVLLSITDPAARVNAVTTGAADYASDIPFSTAKAGVPGSGLQIRKGPENLRTSYGFVVNTTRPLGGNANVRMALRLGVDRQALIDTVLLGYGVPANDLFGSGAEYFDSNVPVVEHDPDRARSMLDEAGFAGQPFIIRSAEYEVGLNSSAEVYAEQLRGIGLEARTEIVGLTDFFEPNGLSQSDAVAFPLGAFSLGVVYNRTAAYPSLALADPELQSAVATANATTSEHERARAWTQAQQVMADRGNWVVWGLADVLSLARDDLGGIEPRESPKYPWLGKVGFVA